MGISFICRLINNPVPEDFTGFIKLFINLKFYSVRNCYFCHHEVIFVVLKSTIVNI